MARLTQNSYGKSAVRITKVVRDTPVHQLMEFDVAVQLEGDFEAAYTVGDNRLVIATDTVKNTVYVVAKENKFDSAEAYALILANHFIKTYSHVSKATVEIAESSWKRIGVAGKHHEHSFINGGTELHTVKATADRSGKPILVGGVTDLQVLKTTKSAWKDFHSDRYRTLKDTSDRIMATSVTATWTYSEPTGDFPKITAAIREALLTTFATHDSLGVQQTMYAMGEAALKAAPAIKNIFFRLPNSHRIPFNLDPFGLKFENDIYVTTSEPYGDISAMIERE